MVWEAYHFGGEDACRIDLLDVYGNVVSSMTFDNIAEGAWFPTVDLAPKLEGRNVAEYELRKLIDGRRQAIKGGFYYEARLRFSALDLAHAGYLRACINHCMKPGNYTVEFYPYSDNTAVHFRAFLTGDVTDFDEYQRPLVIAHSATIEIYGLEPQDEVFWDAPEGMICLDKTIIYPLIEMAHSQCGGKGIAYTDAEMETDLGYVLNKNKAIV